MTSVQWPILVYSQNVASLAHRLTSLAMMFALSGSPAALSACVALCMEGMAGSHEGLSAEKHETKPAAPTVVAGHGHHGAPVPHEALALVSHHSSVAPDATDTRLGSSCEDCCSSNPQGFVSRLGTVRVDAKSLVAAVATPVASFLLAHAGSRSSHLSPPIAPPAPPRAPLALRI